MTFSELYKKCTSRIVWGNLLAMGALACLLVVGLLVFIDFYTHHGETVTVPDVRGQLATVAQKKLEAVGMRVEITDTGHVTTLPAGVILDQNLEPGTEVKVNRLIRLTINSATATTIPFPNDVIDGSLHYAKKKLEIVGFKLGAIRRVEGDLNLVYSAEVNGKSVHPGERISTESPITLVVGNGQYEEVYNGNDAAAWDEEEELEELETDAENNEGGETTEEETQKENGNE